MIVEGTSTVCVSTAEFGVDVVVINIIYLVYGGYFTGGEIGKNMVGTLHAECV